jgi:type II secretory pathway pseudopilin PulG
MCLALTAAFWVVVKAIKTVKSRKANEEAELLLRQYLRELRRKHPKWSDRMLTKHATREFKYIYNQKLAKQK